MSKSEELRAFYEANIACGDISEAAEARMLADIAAAEIEENSSAAQVLEQPVGQAA